ncbi:TPA: transposase, partial [Photobacterium damselae]
VTASVIKSFANNDKHLGNRIGFTSVLHTHNRRRDLHPHIHMVITGGGFDDEKRQWNNCKNKYLFNAFALAKVWRARLLAYLTTELKWTLPVLQFLWLILQHVLPKGFRRVRDYGLLRGHEKKRLQAIQFMFMLAGQLTLPSPNKTVRIKAQPFCPCCQHVMQLTGIFRPK